MARDYRFDGLKLIMIFLVVLGHLGYNDYGLKINKMIYSFHMPVFVFLSGYYTSLNKSIPHQNIWFRKTILIYVFAQLLHVLITPLIGEEIKWNFLISPHLALWYLVCLLYWRFAFWRYLYRWNDIHLFILSLLLAIVSGYIPIDHDFSFQRTFSFFPFFVLGVIFKKRQLLSLLDKVPIYISFIAVIIGLVIAYVFPFLYLPKTHYVFTPEPCIRGIQTFIGIFLCLAFVSVTRNFHFGKLGKYGQYTLWIYIGHTYLIRIGNYVFERNNYTLNLIQAVILAFFYCALFIWMSKVYGKMKEKRCNVINKN